MNKYNDNKYLNQKLIICVIGLPGAGKSLFCSVSNQLGFSVINMGDQIRKEIKKRGLSDDAETLNKMMIKLRKENGRSAIANICIPIIKESQNKHIIIDGIRNIEEIKEFQKIGKVITILITNTTERRMNFLIGRGRKDAPLDKKSFRKRDENEISIGLDKVLEIPDIKINNSGLTKEEFKIKSKQILLKLIKK